MRRSSLFITCVVSAAAFAVPFSLLAFPTNPPTGLTGAPGEGTCAGCHSSPGTGSVKLVVQGTSSSPSTWAPGITQHLTVTIAETGKQAWGYQLSARDTANAQSGTLTATNANSVTQTASGVQYVYQANAQTSTPDAASYNFDWTPPATGSGNVTFYLVGVAGKNSSNDSTYKASYALTSGVTASPSLSVTPTALNFTMTLGGSAPAAQTFQVTSSGAAVAITTSVGTTSGGSWLTATPPGGNTPQTISVTANPAGLAVGTYKGTVAIASAGASNSPQLVGVTLIVQSSTSKPNLSSAPTSLTFNASGTTAIPSQTLALSSSGAALNLTAAASTTTGGNWLSVTPVTGTTPVSLSVSASATGLAAGTYQGQIMVTSTGAANSPLSVPVTLTVGSAPPTTGISSFSFVVLDAESGGPTEALITGSGNARSKTAFGGGTFAIFTPSPAPPFSVGMSGSWHVTGVVSHTQVASTPQAASTAAVLQLNVMLNPTGGAALPAVMTISGTGQETGVSLNITGGASYVPSGIADIRIGTKPGGEGERRGD